MTTADPSWRRSTVSVAVSMGIVAGRPQDLTQTSPPGLTGVNAAIVGRVTVRTGHEGPAW